jgi:hypothetical protein|tara:strand:+ start:388 stop:1167 length:780 start_codon:yes stop_codon:yes gene_type:complete
MSIQLRQICLVSSNLKKIEDELCSILGLEVCHRDPGVAQYGLENFLLPIGSNFIEVVAPSIDNTAAGRYLERRKGDCGYMVITQVDSRTMQSKIRQRAEAKGVRVAHEAEREGWNFCQLHPADMVASMLDIEWDEQENFEGCWHPAGGLTWLDKVRRDVTADILGVELQSEDPIKLANLWGSVIDCPMRQDDASATLALNNASIRCVRNADDRGPGLSGVDLLVEDRERIIEAAKLQNCFVHDYEIKICGTRFYLFNKA